MPQKIQVKNIRHGNPGLSGWYAILPEPEPTHVLEEDLTADWLVIWWGVRWVVCCKKAVTTPGKREYSFAGFHPDR